MFNNNSPLIQNIFGMNNTNNQNSYEGYPYGYLSQSPPIQQAPYNPYQQYNNGTQYNPYRGNTQPYNPYNYNQNMNYNYYQTYQSADDNLYGVSQIGGYDVYQKPMGYPKSSITDEAQYDAKYDIYQQYGYYDYYGNYCNQYLSPYEIKMIEDKRQKEAMEMMQQEINRNKKLSRIAHKYFGEEVSDEYLDSIYDPKVITPNNILQEQYTKEYNDNYQTIECCRLAQNMDNIYAYQDSQIANVIAAHQKITDSHNRMVNPNSDLVDFLKDAGSLYLDAIVNEQKIRNRENKMKYDSKEFQSRINSSSFNYSITDDNVIALPNHLRGDYQEQKARFMKAILGSQGGSVYSNG